MADSNNSPADKCTYCGKENIGHLASCSGCGTALIELEIADESSGKKSMALALFLAMTFGPLGLLYVNVTNGLLLLAISLPFTLTGTGRPWVSIVVRLVCVVLAFNVMRSESPSVQSMRQQNDLLDEAARLENVDREKAILAYQKIAENYPDTPAGREAARNIELLQRQANRQNPLP